MVHLIGPGLRPEVPELCITSEMCLPIFPNTFHPSGQRQPLQPRPMFPFTNCYHWFGPDMLMDIRVWNDDTEYPKEDRTVLPGEQHADMDQYRGRDIWKSVCARRERNGTQNADSNASAAEPSDPKEEEGSAASRHEVSLSRSPCEEKCSAAFGSYDDDESRAEAMWPHSEDGSESSRSESFSYQGSEERNKSADALPDMDIFGLDDDELDNLLPIVKISLDIGAHFKDEEVPSPMDFIKQRDELVKYVCLPSFCLFTQAHDISAESYRTAKPAPEHAAWILMTTPHLPQASTVTRGVGVTKVCPILTS